jgi:adenylate kinase
VFPHSGKTALSRHLTKAYGLTPLSSGVLIRSEISRGTDLGNSIRSTVESGGLIADATVLHLVEQEIRRLQANDSSWPGVILDGFPRTLPQARMLDAPDSPLPPLSPMVYVHMRDDILAERRAGRRICPVCGASYNLHAIDRDGYYLAARHPKHADQTKCDRENATLVAREDDREDIAQRRMKAFREESLPMVQYYKDRGVLIDIEKTRSAGQVFKKIRAQMEMFMDEEREKEIKKMEKEQKKNSKKNKKDGEKESKKDKKSAEPEEEEEEVNTPQHPKHSVNTPRKRQSGGGN